MDVWAKKIQTKSIGNVNEHINLKSSMGPCVFEEHRVLREVVGVTFVVAYVETLVDVLCSRTPSGDDIVAQCDLITTR